MSKFPPRPHHPCPPADDRRRYNEATSSPVEITITKATPTGEPKYTRITTRGKALKDAALTLEGSTLSPADGNYTALTGSVELYHKSGSDVADFCRLPGKAERMLCPVH